MNYKIPPHSYPAIAETKFFLFRAVAKTISFFSFKMPNICLRCSDLLRWKEIPVKETNSGNITLKKTYKRLSSIFIRSSIVYLKTTQIIFFKSLRKATHYQLSMSKCKNLKLYASAQRKPESPLNRTLICMFGKSGKTNIHTPSY